MRCSIRLFHDANSAFVRNYEESRNKAKKEREKNDKKGTKNLAII